MKDEILKKILDKIKERELAALERLIVDRIDVVVLKELYNDVVKLKD